MSPEPAAGGRRMRAFAALPPHRGYTLGPAFLWTGWQSIEEIQLVRLPVILIAEYLDQRMLASVPLERVLGIVIDRGSVIDPLWDALADVRRPSLIGATGVFRVAEPEETVIVDAAGGHAILRPTDEVLARYRSLKGLRPPRESQLVRDILQTVVDRIRLAWLHAGRPVPYDLAEQRQLYAMAQRIAGGGFPTPEDDALVARILPAQQPRGGSEPGAADEARSP